MQTKFKRYTGSKGMISKHTTYCLDAIVLPTAEEKVLMDGAGRWSTSVWTYSDEKNVDLDDEVYKHLGHLKMEELLRGVRFEYESHGSVIRTEEAILEAFRYLLSVSQTLATFDGRERVFEIDAGGHELLAAG